MTYLSSSRLLLRTISITVKTQYNQPLTMKRDLKQVAFEFMTGYAMHILMNASYFYFLQKHHLKHVFNIYRF